MDESGFTVVEQDAGDELRVVVSGELDLATADGLSARLLQLADAGRPTLLDLSPLTFMDSSGLRALMLARERAVRDSWRLRIVPPQGEAREVLRISGVESYLPLVQP